MSLLNPTQTTVLSQLRGDVDSRPSVRPELQKELQAQLEDALRGVEGPLTVSKHMLNKVHACEGKFMAVDEFNWSPANAKGTIVHKAVELMINGDRPRTPADLVKASIAWICESSATQSLADYLRKVDEAEMAELRNNAIDLVIQFSEMFPPLKPEWRPTVESTTQAFVGHKRLLFQGKIDLKLGVLQPDKSSTLLIDLKTGNPSFTDNDDLRFYALLETLRTGVPPFRWANAYVSAGRAEHEDVSEGLLWSAAKRAADGALKIAALNEGKEPELTPGNACKFCPAKATCPEAMTPPTTIDL